jgi:hypothetical protein
MIYPQHYNLQQWRNLAKNTWQTNKFDKIRTNSYSMSTFATIKNKPCSYTSIAILNSNIFREQYKQDFKYLLKIKYSFTMGGLSTAKISKELKIIQLYMWLIIAISPSILPLMYEDWISPPRNNLLFHLLRSYKIL